MTTQAAMIDVWRFEVGIGASRGLGALGESMAKVCPTVGLQGLWTTATPEDLTSGGSSDLGGPCST